MCNKYRFYRSTVDDLYGLYFGELSRFISSDILKECNNNYLSQKEKINIYYNKNMKAISPICKNKCLNCQHKVIFENSRVISLRYNFVLKYYDLKLFSIYDDTVITIPFNHKMSLYDGYVHSFEIDNTDELWHYIKSIIYIKISRNEYELMLDPMFILHLKVLYKFEVFPREIINQIMFCLFY